MWNGFFIINFFLKVNNKIRVINNVVVEIGFK